MDLLCGTKFYCDKPGEKQEIYSFQTHVKGFFYFIFGEYDVFINENTGHRLEVYKDDLQYFKRADEMETRHGADEIKKLNAELQKVKHKAALSLKNQKEETQRVKREAAEAKAAYDSKLAEIKTVNVSSKNLIAKLQKAEEDQAKYKNDVAEQLRKQNEALKRAANEKARVEAMYETKLADIESINSNLTKLNRNVSGEVLVGNVVFPTASNICETYDDLQVQLADHLEDFLVYVADDYPVLGIMIVDPMLKVLSELVDHVLALKRAQILETFGFPVEKQEPAMFANFLMTACQMAYERLLDNIKNEADTVFKEFIEGMKLRSARKAAKFYDFLCSKDDETTDVLKETRELFDRFLKFTFEYKLSGSKFTLFPLFDRADAPEVFSDKEHKEIKNRAARNRCKMSNLNPGNECKVVIPALTHLGKGGQRVFDIPMRVW